jgi:hypothetical protein
MKISCNLEVFLIFENEKSCLDFEEINMFFFFNFSLEKKTIKKKKIASFFYH